jgi:peroxiredoxin
MQERGGNSLYSVEQLIQAGQRQAALQSLAAYLKNNPNSVQAWWLLSQAVTEEKQQVECLERVLKLNPGHIQARTRLARLKGTTGQPPVPPPVVPFTFSPEEEFAFENLANEPLRESTPDLFFEEPASNQQPSRLPAPSSPTPRPIKKPTARKKKTNLLEMSILAVLLCILTVSAGVLGTLGLKQKMARDLQATQAMEQVWTNLPHQTLPPTWTATVTPTQFSSPTPSITETPSPTIVLSMPVLSTSTSAFRGQPLGPSASLAPDFTLKDVVSGDQVSLSAYRGRPVVVVFWATWCPYCEREMSALKSVYKDYRDAGLIILAVDAGDSASEVRSYRKSHGLTFNVLLDPKRKTVALYKVSAYPTNIFVDRSGRAVYSVVGMMDTAGLTSKVLALMPK